MLLALLGVAAMGVVTFRSSVGGLEEFRRETVGEAFLIERVSGMLVEADDIAEDFVEADTGESGEFVALSGQIAAGFEDLETLTTPEERELAASARGAWTAAQQDVQELEARPGVPNDDDLDVFHDEVDAAVAELGRLHRLNVGQVADEISDLRDREQAQLRAALTTILVGVIVAVVVIVRLRRSLTSPLVALEVAAARFGSDDLSHRVPVHGDDELARVGRAFNGMADKLRTSRDALQFQALHDSLTGLPNRALFMQHLDHAMARAQRRGTDMAVLYLDLDGFKAVNDTYGHGAGDEVLVRASERLQAGTRGESVVARLGGDEFGILLDDCDLAGAGAVAERLCRSFDDLLGISPGGVQLGISVGVAVRQPGDELDALLRRADAAMYAAKARGKARWQAGEEDGDPGGVAEQRADLARALGQQELVVHYQPIVRLATGAVEAVEALVRWDHPARGLLAPAAFLQLAEDTGQVVAIDRFVLREACRQVREWQRRCPGASELRAAVNLSARHLQRPGLAADVRDALAATGLAPEHLTLEITESALLRETGATVDELARLRALGVAIALDDFGTGYSSLSHLLTFPVDMIKLDRSFVSLIGTGARNADLSLGLVGLAGTVGVETVAEGIEEEAQLERLRAAGCPLGQGYLFARPLPADGLEARFLAASSVRV
jgi:diguanylate cyclase (GGDEF)-like protein